MQLTSPVRRLYLVVLFSTRQDFGNCSFSFRLILPMIRRREDNPENPENFCEDRTENVTPEEVDQDPGERQKENQGDQKNDPLAA